MEEQPGSGVSSSMRTFAFVNESCNRRQEEIAVVRRFLFLNGFSECTDPSSTDLVCFFTCAFNQSRVADMMRQIGQLRGSVKADCELIVGSCLPKTDAATLKKVFTGKTITPTDFSELNQLPGIAVKVEDMPPGTETDTLHAPARTQVAVCAEPDHRMGVFISSGCLRSCSYCAIRFATGGLRSKTIEWVARTISEGLDRGYRKFDMYADSIGDYGLDIGTNLGELLEWLLSNPRPLSVGISDLHPQAFLKYSDLLLSLTKAGRIHYLYVPLQSASSRILGLMNRSCDTHTLLDKLLEVRALDGGLFLQTSIIVGFPTETDTEFEETVAFLKAAGFNHVYVHVYSGMPNTASSRMSGKVPRQSILERLNRIEMVRIPHDRQHAVHEWEASPPSA